MGKNQIRRRIKKSDDTHRLVNIVTEEVSVVDRPANKRKFLIVKNDDGEETQADVSKGFIYGLLEIVGARVVSLSKAIETIKESGEGFSKSFVDSTRSIQAMLKCISSQGEVSLFIPDVVLSDSATIPEGTRDQLSKIANEVERRIAKMKTSLEGVEVLDGAQSDDIKGLSDFAGSMLLLAKNDSLKITADSIPEENRPAVLKTIRGAIENLSSLELALSTSVSKSEQSAPQSEVLKAIDISTEMIQKSIVQALSDPNDPVGLIVDFGNEIKKAFDGASEELKKSIAPFSEYLAEISKAAKMYCVSYRGNKDVVVLRTPDEVVAEFDTYEEAKFDALRRNVEMINKAVQKRFVVKVGGKGYQVINQLSGAVVWDGESKDQADAFAAKANLSAMGKNEGEEAAVSGETTKTEKVGTPMKASRLKRLKEAVSMLHDALGDLSGGVSSMEKFNKAAEELGVLIEELSIQKGVNAHRGIDDTRGLTPDKANAGSGVQPDTSVISDSSYVGGQGTQQLDEILKELKGVKAKQAEQDELIAKKDQTIADLQETIDSLKKTRSAPSSAGEEFYAPAVSGNDDGKVSWPTDMANWDPEQ